jgi:hypothetical protein
MNGARSTRLKVLAGLVWVTAAVWSSQAVATEADLSQLPVIEPYLCLTCHTTSDPTPASHGLNLFGADYLVNGRVWNFDLAQLDSDGDGCLNGVEIGDSDGDGIADGNVTEQASNPGFADDCDSGSLVDERTWSELKALFDGDR